MAAISKARRLNRVREKLKSELEDLELAGLDDRAETVREQIRQVSEKMKTIKQEHRERENERRRRNREAEERHAKAQRELKEQMERRSEVREWYRSWQRLRGGFPQPAERVLAAAEEAGHDPQDVESALTRVKRLKNGVHCFTFRGEYLRGKYRAVEELPGRVKV